MYFMSKSASKYIIVHFHNVSVSVSGRIGVEMKIAMDTTIKTAKHVTV